MPALRNTKGTYFFVLDVFIAASILVLTIIVILSSRVNIPETSQNYFLAEDFLNFLTQTRIRDLTLYYRNTLIADGNITDVSLFIHQQIAQWYWNMTNAKDPDAANPENPADPCGIEGEKASCRHGYVAREFIEQMALGIIPDQFGFAYSVNETVMYNRSNDTRPQAEILLVARKTTFFLDSEGFFFGPVNTTVEVWS